MRPGLPTGTLALLALGIAACTSASRDPAAPPEGAGAGAAPAAAALGDMRISGPHVHRSLAVFVIHGADREAGKTFLTLEEAMAQNKVVVYETGNVQELAIENLAADVEIYIQSGDIVRGGRQDRVLAQDVIIPAKSGRVPLASFCVEQGRWSQRGDEAAHRFSASENQIATKDLKIAAKRARDQQQIWGEVAKAQARLAESLGAPVASPASASSLELTLENEAVKRSIAEYVEALRAVVEREPDAIGFAFAIDGKLNSAEVYATGALFRKLWPKLLEAAATEAVAEGAARKAGAAPAPPPAPAAVAACLADAHAARPAETISNARCDMVTRESEKNLFFETRDKARGGAWLHRSYVAK